MILLDTNVISEFMRPAPDKTVEAWFERVAVLPLFIAMITQAELLTGIWSMPEGKRRSALAQAIDKMIAEDFANRVLVFDEAASRAYAEIASVRRRLGRPISANDCQIAAIARVNSLQLATRNTGDFQSCGIELINPWVQPMA